MLIIKVPYKSVAENTARTSTPKKNRIETLFGKVVSEIGAQNTFEKTRSKDDGVEKSSPTKSMITVLKNRQKTVFKGNNTLTPVQKIRLICSSKNEHTRLFTETLSKNWKQNENGTKMLLQKQS